MIPHQGNEIPCHALLPKVPNDDGQHDINKLMREQYPMNMNTVRLNILVCEAAAWA